MHRDSWHGLAATYAIIAGIQLYIAVTSGVVWAVMLSAAAGLAAAACGTAAWRATGETRQAGRALVLPRRRDRPRSTAQESSPLSESTAARHAHPAAPRNSRPL